MTRWEGGGGVGNAGYFNIQDTSTRPATYEKLTFKKKIIEKNILAAIKLSVKCALRFVIGSPVRHLAVVSARGHRRRRLGLRRLEQEKKFPLQNCRQ